jgi:O-antigen/teichoic acid export membrane protein
LATLDINLKKNFIFSFVEKIFRAVLSVTSLVIVGRYLGPESYGLLNYLIAVVTYFQLVGVFGLDHVLVGMLVKEQENRDIIFWQSLKFKTIMSLLSYIFYLGYLGFHGELTWYSSFFGLAILGALLDNSRIYLESQNKHDVISKVEMLYQLITSIIKIILCYLKIPVTIIFLVFLFDFIIPKFMLLLRLKSSNLNYQLLSIALKWKDLVRFFKSGIYHFFSMIFVLLYMKIDQVMVGNILGMKQLGNYAAAVRLSDAWYFIPVTIASVFYPASLLEAREKNNRNLQLIFDLTLWISLLVVGFAFIINDRLYEFMFGDGFYIEKAVLNLLFVSGILISITVSTNAWLNMKGASKVLFVRTLVGAVVNISLNYYLIPRFGLIGCAWATLIAYTITCLLTLLAKDSKECGIYFLNSFNLPQLFLRLNQFRVGNHHK